MRCVELIAAFSFLAAFALWAGCSEQTPRSGDVSVNQLPDSEIEKAVIRFTDGPIERMVLKAGHISRFEKEDSTYATGVHADFFDEDGNYSSTLTSDFGVIWEKSEELLVWGNVVVVSKDSVKLETESLRWDPEKEVVHTDDFVTITREDDILMGYGFESDRDLNNMRIFREVKGVMTDVPTEEELDELERK